MKLLSLIIVFLTSLSAFAQITNGMKSIKDFGVLPTNTPIENRNNLQKAIDWASPMGAALFIEPVENGYPIASGILLKRNVSLIGVHGPLGRGSSNPQKNAPTGSLFNIMDADKAFITVESSTQIRGIQFYYPIQEISDPSKIIEYPPTIQISKNLHMVECVTLSSLSFFNEFIAMDFVPANKNACEQILIEHCYGYPLSGEFVKISRCYDIPRILHCHVNPANMREFNRAYSRQVIDSVVARKTFSYWLDHIDNAQLMDIFTFGVFGGIYLGSGTYGQLTNFNLDCVSIGIFKGGNNPRNRNWMISQGSIIANVGDALKDVHPFVIEGQGHTSITNVEAFSGDNGAVTNHKSSYDFMLIKGDKALSVSLIGCRFIGYSSENPITIENPNAKVIAVACIDAGGNFFEMKKSSKSK